MMSCAACGVSSPLLQQWREIVEARVCTLENWSSGVGTIWRGSLHFTEHRVCLQQGIELCGFYNEV